MSGTKGKFAELLAKLKAYGPVKSPDFVAIALPLLESVNQMHQNNRVALLTSIEQISYDDAILALISAPRESIRNDNQLFKKTPHVGPVEVSGAIGQTTDLNDQSIKHTNLEIQVEGTEVTQPVFIPAYRAWDYECGHYDPLTDVFQLGQILASVAYNLDFNSRDELNDFVSNRKRLYFLNRDLHPTLHSIIYEMTNLYREERSKSLEEVIIKMKNYREYNPENYIDLTQSEGFRTQDLSDRDNWILAKLKSRLFDISRRNKLLYFTDRKSFLNLTISSVPLLLDYQNIHEDSLIFWNDTIQKKCCTKKKLPLNSYLELKENKFIEPALNTIRLDARRSQNEYGFSQMRMVIAFLHWYNFKENIEERITSPLLLLPAEIVKKKGVEDQYTLEFSSTEAEINPILIYYLKDLYNIDMPDFIDLETTSVKDLLNSIEMQIAAGGTGIKLEWRSKPKIKLIHSIAKKNFNIKNRKLANRSQGLNLNSFVYSYDRESFQPLGLQIFNERIRYRNNALEYIINEDLRPQDNLQSINPKNHQAVAEKERSFYSTDNEGVVNPLVWEVDTCNITIGNFNYRKMSLVRDYNEIINSNIKDEVFEQLFSELPKKSAVTDRQVELKDSYPIIASDPTQSSAVSLARSGESYIIQGPPGTGKSQTITNLIADYISRDKKVLFVCEKRAALDVVYHRLKNKNLDELCCLVHDSQMDKKAFIQDLKNVYSDFQERTIDPVSVGNARNTIVEYINKEINVLDHFHQSMREGDPSPLELFSILHANKQDKGELSETDIITLPGYASWKENGEWISEWLEQLSKNKLSDTIAEYPLAQLSDELLGASNPKAKVLDSITQSINHLDNLLEFLDGFDDEVIGGEKTLGEWQAEVVLAEKVIGLSQLNKIEVLNAVSAHSIAYQSARAEIATKEQELRDHEKKNQHWTHKFSLKDTKNALDHWQRFQATIFRFFMFSYYRLKKKIKQSYDFNAHDIPPRVDAVLSELLAENEVREQVQYQQKQFLRDFNLDDYETDCAWIEDVQKKPNQVLARWIVVDSDDHIKLHDYLSGLVQIKSDIESLVNVSTQLFGSVDALPLVDLEAKLAQGKKALSSLSVFLPYIKQASSANQTLKHCLFSRYWKASDFSYYLAYKSLCDIYERNRSFQEADGDTLQLSVVRINALMDKYYESNVESIRSRIHQKFMNLIRITESTAAQLTQNEKALKKTYLVGRRILENEFGKSMRYKSIRELTSGEAKEVMTTLKPVWLMSPLSVSDVLPIDTSIFDVVIYDEASQITLEEGVPSLFRTNQTIVVGDEMQMPPTNFFSTSVAQDEDEEEAENRIGISLDAESLLNQSSRKLSSVMLGWHYRSRHESLISFSNAAFYQRSLLTIPDVVTHEKKATGTQEGNSLASVLDVNAEVDVDQILKRSISFHYLENAIYENRKNRDEADYIANIIRQLLKSDSNKSIGIVAFSMDQQSEIESALDRLASEDGDFDRLLEEEYQREDEDQFNGLFVKNLENVQGDERDIIIMSVCYGANAKGKMLMNFGPINRRGGEKRLNVIFSRAKENMVVVSSILANEIKNDYNEGANYFKRFLAYAKYCSDGREVDADLVLDSMFRYDESVVSATRHTVVQELSGRIRNLGYQVDVMVGRSHFKCDIAVKHPDGERYVIGIMIDRPSHYENSNILEQYCQKTEILKAFGWRIVSVYCKDWFERPDRVLTKIEQHLGGDVDDGGFRIIDIELDALVVSQKSVADASQGECVGQEVCNIETADVKSTEKADLAKQDESSRSLVFERLEFKSENSNKYWQVAINGSKLQIQYGRIGNNPQQNEKVYGSVDKAFHDKEKLIATKLKKGYVRVDSKDS